jgi:hypothetical protein
MTATPFILQFDPVSLRRDCAKQPAALQRAVRNSEPTCGKLQIAVLLIERNTQRSVGRGLTDLLYCSFCVARCPAIRAPEL